jgi:hypothetical protein
MQRRANSVEISNSFILFIGKHSLFFSAYLYGHLTCRERMLSFVLLRYEERYRVTYDDYCFLQLLSMSFCVVSKTKIIHRVRERHCRLFLGPCFSDLTSQASDDELIFPRQEN